MGISPNGSLRSFKLPVVVDEMSEGRLEILVQRQAPVDGTTNGSTRWISGLGLSTPPDHGRRVASIGLPKATHARKTVMARFLERLHAKLLREWIRKFTRSII
jgi:hypothetical protein